MSGGVACVRIRNETTGAIQPISSMVELEPVTAEEAST